jgi:hypothetical protein
MSTTAEFGESRFPLIRTIALAAVISCGFFHTSVAQDAPGAVSFSKDVAPILYERCAVCHRATGPAPFDLVAYRGVKDRAALIGAVIETRMMPPWQPEPGHGVFAGDRRMSEEEIDMVRRWVQQGAPEGDPADLPPTPEWPEEWELGEPDLVLEVPAYTLRGEGTDVYRNLVVSIPVSRTRYVKAVELLPGHPKVVHHARMMIDTTRSSRVFDDQDAEPGFDGMDLISQARNAPGFFLGWTPGKVPYEGAEDMTWRLDPETDLVLQLHLRPSGQPAVVQARVGFHFAEAPPTRIPTLVMLGSFELDIPPGEKDYLVTDSYELPVDVDALSIYPHAHYLGKEIQGIATLPDGTRKWLIRINDWDFNWQDEYRFAEPVFLPKGTTVTMRWVYDNSASNPQNPNRPPKRVVYGSKSTDEMSDLVVQVLPRNRNDLEILERDFARASYEKEINRQLRQHYGIGRALATQGKFDEAIGHYREAIQLRSDDARVVIAMARAFASKGDLDGANLIADRAIQLGDQDDPVVLDGLAAVYAAAGDTNRAVRTAEQAIRLASSAGNDQLADEIRQNLERYRQGKPE